MSVPTRPNAAVFLAFLLILDAAWGLWASAAPADPRLSAELAAGRAQKCWKIDLNTAPEEQLVLVDGIGKRLAQKIVDERERGGPFKSRDDFASRIDMRERYMERIADETRISGGRE